MNCTRPSTRFWLPLGLSCVFSVSAILPAGAQAPAAQSDAPAQTGAAQSDAQLARATASVLIDNGLAYLKRQQQGDGGWQRSEKEPLGVTSLVLKAFVQQPTYTSTTDPAKQGFERLLSFQLEDGGIYKNLLASYNTAIAISTLTAAKDPAMKERIERAVTYLRTLQWTPETVSAEDEKISSDSDPWYGGWGYGGRSRGKGRPDLSNTQFAIEAMHEAGVKSDDPAMQAALKFVTRVQNRSESNDQPWAGNDGGFAYGPSDARDGESFAGAYTDTDGKRRLHSMGTMTYAGLKSFIYAGLSKDDPRVQAAWRWINANWTLDEHPGMSFSGEDKKRNGLFYYYHTLARALRVYGEPTITTPQGKTFDWRVELISSLAKQQNADGSWTGTKAYMEDNPIMVTAYIVLALQEAVADLNERPAK